jgi:nucleoid-associated protein YgaU
MPPPPLVFQEQTGPKRRVALAGRSLPKELALGSSQRHEIEWNPGSGEATLQIFGPSLEPISLAGAWHTRYLANQEAVAVLNGSTQILDTVELSNLFESLCECGQLIRLSWNSMVRYGIITQFKTVFARPEDATWEMEFKPISKTGTAAAPVNPKRPSLAGFSAQLDAAAAALLTQRQTPPAVPVDTSILKEFDRAIARLGEMAGEVQDTISGYATQVLDVATATRRTMAHVSEALQNVRSGIEMIQSTTYRELLAITDQGEATVGQIVATAGWLYEIERTGGTFRRRAFEFRDAMQDRVITEYLGTYTVVAGDDLMSIAQRYYQSQDPWWRIAEANGLLSAEVSPGTLLLLPRLPDA